MYTKIMVPIDLVHADRLGKTIDTATGLGKLYGIPVCFVGVTTEAPSAVARTPKEFGDKLAAFGAEQAQAHALSITTAAYASHDPTIDLEKTLVAAAKEHGCDLIVMASHLPGAADHIFASHAGTVAAHAEVSVFVVR